MLALDSIYGMMDNRLSRGGSHGKGCKEHRLAKEKILIPVTEDLMKSSAKPSYFNWKNLRRKEGKRKSLFPVAKNQNSSSAKPAYTKLQKDPNNICDFFY